MNIYIFILSLVVTVIYSLVLWCSIFKKYFDLKGNLSIQVKEKILPDISKSNSSIIMLSSAAIPLIFSIVQLWKDSLLHKYLLIFSLICFTICILVCITINSIIYVFRTSYFVGINKVMDTRNYEGEEKRKKREQARDSLNESGYFEKYLFWLLFMQSIVFSMAILYLLLFVIVNLQ